MYGQKKQVTLTTKAAGAWSSLKKFPDHLLKIRKSSTTDVGQYCLYTIDLSPVCMWPRKVIDELIANGMLVIEKDFTFKVLN